ncbi:ABC transporter permease [Thiohalorhabdus methylotrophus]|uniref:ABC transporter permease n=1 Tax=Thiohalorhabdus methylotrophus TaxID=3242694 RepID=A0ABV4TYC0_9GAMM
MRDRFLLAGYLAAVVALTFLHSIPALGVCILAALALSGRAAPRLLGRSVRAILLFNLTVSLSYAAVAWWQGHFPAEYLLRINLRVLLLVFLGFWLVERVNLARALAFSRSLMVLVTLSAGQALAFRRLVGEFRQAFRSRGVGPMTLADRYRFAATLAGHLLDLAVERSAEVVRAMRSRGVFDD